MIIMGIVCEFYRISDSGIDALIADGENADEYLDENYASIYGKFHIEDDIHFYTDKAWGIALYLLESADLSSSNIIADIRKDTIPGSSNATCFIKSAKVRKINESLQQIELNKLFDLYNEEKMIGEGVYKAGELTDQEFITSHAHTIKKAFMQAAKHLDGIVVAFR
ncbi:MAG: DUF1877 family protein [Flavobacterium sp.]|nr:MAG: DUF1877 family protein [Flavobacterium sp.]